MSLVTTTQLTDALDHLRAAPHDEGPLVLVVRRPQRGERELLDEATLNLEHGLVGDGWLDRATDRAKAAGTHLQAQVTVMSARMVALLADTPERRALAGDQLYVDLDLSHDNLPAGARIAVGDTAVLEVSARPHTGCAKFQARFGDDALAFVNSDEGRHLRLRGLNARLVAPGVVHPGDVVRRLP
ncbi:MAG: hypothetical protein U0R80_03725 [Nocardioidaceae bacterium]